MKVADIMPFPVPVMLCAVYFQLLPFPLCFLRNVALSFKSNLFIQHFQVLYIYIYIYIYIYNLILFETRSLSWKTE